MDTLTKKTITTKRGFEYTYYVSPAAAGKPTLALHHGFPDQAEEWEDLIVNHLKPAGYGVIAPDLLGYGGTSKPTDPESYKFGGMTADVVEIIDAEKVDKVISLGHDWGSRAAQMLYNLHPERVSGLVMVNVPWMGATKGPMDLDALLAQAQQVFGYGTFWYWKLFTADDVCYLNFLLPWPCYLENMRKYPPPVMGCPETALSIWEPNEHPHVSICSSAHYMAFK